MKAAILRDFSSPLSVEDLRLAPPGPREVRVAVTACAICQSDLHAIRGDWEKSLPAVFGHDAAGTVIETGAGVPGLAAGDSVVVTLIRYCGSCAACARSEPGFCCGQFSLDDPGPLAEAGGAPIAQGFRTGAFAEEVVVHASQAVRMPESVPPEHAALLACGALTGFGAVANTANLQPGENAAVFGVGGVGMNSVQAARIRGAEIVITVDPSEEKRAMARDLGATHAVDPTREDPVRRIRSIAGGGGVDCTITTVATGEGSMRR